MSGEEIYEANLPEFGSVPLDYFSGGRFVTDGRLSCLLNDVARVTSTFHAPITLEGTSSAPGQQPTREAIGSTLVTMYTIGVHRAYRVFRIPQSFVGDAAFHVHWTKEAGAGGNGDESGNSVRWRISYTVSPGGGADINVAPTVIELDDTYDDSGTTTRIMYRAGEVAAPGFIPDFYVAMCIESVVPAGSALSCDPGLIAADLTYTQKINI